MESLNKFNGVGHWFLRLALAGIFLYHGILKFPMAGGLAKMMGMPVIAVYMLALMEIIGSLLILWGGFGPDWASRVGGILFSIVMLGAIFMVHAKHGWNSVSMNPNKAAMGAEFQTLILAASLFFVVKGNTANGVTTTE